MKLKYYTEELNFGDALNQVIFEHYCGDLLDDNEEVILLGIGTILGLEKGNAKTKKIVVFSSGLGFGNSDIYGEAPVIDEKYDVLCVRGPYTAEKLKLDKSLAISDGALLLHGMEFSTVTKEYKWTYIPHHISDKLYNWERVVKRAGGHYLSMNNQPEFVIDEIRKSNLIIAEAMHGAIVSDIFRVPWIPAKAYEHINKFKWMDWLSTVNLSYNPNLLPSLFKREKIEELISLKVFKGKTKLLVRPLAIIYMTYQRLFVERKAVKQLKKITKSPSTLSNIDVLNERYQQLNNKMAEFKNKYKG